jgi:chemotaxis protein CheZ
MAGDTEDLDALFDSIAESRLQQAPEAVAAQPAEVVESPQDELEMGMFEQVGRCTRQLHDAMRQLGYDQTLLHSSSQIADAKGRLEYVAELTEKAANKVLNAVDEGLPEEDLLLGKARTLADSWELLFSGKLGIEEFKALAQESRGFTQLVAQTAERQKARMMDIMMAQDFQDITGQIIKKIVGITQTHEQELAKILRDHAPRLGAGKIEEKSVDLLAGPAVPANALAQDDVDDLLADLGF